MPKRLAVFAAALFNASCAPVPEPPDALDHTPYSAIQNAGECRCLKAKRLVVSPANPVACFSGGTESCGIRIDCVAPEADEHTRAEALACRAG